MPGQQPLPRHALDDLVDADVARDAVEQQRVDGVKGETRHHRVRHDAAQREAAPPAGRGAGRRQGSTRPAPRPART